MISPDAPDQDKQRHLRALYRDHRPEARWNGNKQTLDAAQQKERTWLLNAEYARLYGREDRAMLAHILKSAWIEERELAGQTYDRSRQAWLNPDGTLAL